MAQWAHCKPARWPVATAAQTWLAVVDRVTVGGRVPTPPVLAAAEGAPRVQGGTGRLGGRLNTALSGKCKGCCARQQRQRWQEVRHWFQQLGLLCLFEKMSFCWGCTAAAVLGLWGHQ